MEQVSRAVLDGDLTTFVNGLQREPWLLGDAYVWFQTGLIESATLNDRGEFITALLDRDPALLRCHPPPQSQAIEFAVTYAKTHLLPVLTRIWPLPDDLPHAAAMGILPRVKDWFDESGAPALGDLDNHYPYNDPRARSHLHWDPPTAQQVLDTALAFSVINRHFEVADFLLEHGADINTTWNSHEPASILHHLVFYGDYDSMRFLIDRGIDMTIKDYRWKQDCPGLGALWQEGREDGSVAGGCGDGSGFQAGPRRRGPDGGTTMAADALMMQSGSHGVPIGILLCAVACGSTPIAPETAASCEGFGTWQTSEYVLPYPRGASYTVDQGNCAAPGNGHTGVRRYGYDLLMPIGSRIIAARGGTVLQVEESHSDGDIASTGSDNYVVIEHFDRTTALYGHLTRDGAFVGVGDVVELGARYCAQREHR